MRYTWDQLNKYPIKFGGVPFNSVNLSSADINFGIKGLIIYSPNVRAMKTWSSHLLLFRIASETCGEAAERTVG